MALNIMSVTCQRDVGHDDFVAVYQTVVREKHGHTKSAHKPSIITISWGSNPPSADDRNIYAP